MLKKEWYFEAADVLWNALIEAKELPEGLEQLQGDELKEEKCIRLCAEARVMVQSRMKGLGGLTMEQIQPKPQQWYTDPSTIQTYGFPTKHRDQMGSRYIIYKHIYSVYTLIT